MCVADGSGGLAILSVAPARELNGDGSVAQADLDRAPADRQQGPGAPAPSAASPAMASGQKPALANNAAEGDTSLRQQQRKGAARPQTDPPARKINLLAGTWQQLHDRGCRELREGRLLEAERDLCSALATLNEGVAKELRRPTIHWWEVPREDPRSITSCICLAEVNRQWGRYEIAKQLLRAWPERDSEQFPPHAECRAVVNLDHSGLAWFEIKMGMEAAEKLHGRNSVACARFASLWARELVGRDEWVGAQMKIAEGTHLLASTPVSDADIAFIRYNCGLALLEHGAFDRAEEYLTAAESAWTHDPSPNPSAIADARHALSECYRRQGLCAQAEPMARQALTVLEGLVGPDNPRVVAILTTLGACHDARGEYDRSIPLYERAARMLTAMLPPERKPRRRVGNPRLCLLLAETQHRLGDAFMARGEHASAASSYAEAMFSYRIHGGHHGFRGGYGAFAKTCRRALLQKSRAELAAGRPERAVKTLEALVKADRTHRGAFAPQRVQGLLTLADAMRKAGSAASAVAHERDAQVARDAFFGNAADDGTRKLLWQALQGAWDEQYDAALSAMARRSALRRPRLLRMLRACSEPQLLAAVRQEALESHLMLSLALRCRDRAEAAKRALEVEMAYKSMAMDIQASQVETVHASADPQVKALAEQIAALRRQVAATKNAEDPDPARPTSVPTSRPTNLLEQNLVEPSAQGIRYVRETRLPDGSWRRVVSSYGVSSEPAEFGPMGPLEQRLESLEAKLAAACAPFAHVRDLRRCNWESFLAALPDDAAFVSYMIFHDAASGEDLFHSSHRYIAVVVRKNGPPSLHDLGIVRHIDPVIDDYARTLADAPWEMRAKGERRAEAELRAQGAKLFSIMVEPMWSVLKDCHTWIISPDGKLSTLPLGLLCRPGSDGYLIDDYNISYVTSARDVPEFGSVRPGGPVALIFADPDFSCSPEPPQCHVGEPFETRHLGDLSWGSLPGTRIEASRIEKLFAQNGIPTDVRLGPQATKQALLTAQAPRILHIASHGFFLADPTMSYNADPLVRTEETVGGRKVIPPNPLLCSGLAMAGANGQFGVRDAIVTAYEMKWMNLWGTELVCLSACETGLGGTTTGGGVRGLRQSLLQSGAKRIVASLWKIPDQQTAQLMTAFYRRALLGRPAGESLREAMLEVRAVRQDAESAAHPFFWGGFVLVGDPGCLQLPRASAETAPSQ